MNITPPTQGPADPLPNRDHMKGETWNWVLIVLCVLMCIIGMIGNGLVIYTANRNPKAEAFRHLNKVVRNLAVTDLLFCILGAPLKLTYWIWSKILIAFMIEFSAFNFFFKLKINAQ